MVILFFSSQFIQLRELKCGTLGVSNLACLVCYDRISNAFHLFIALGNKPLLDIQQKMAHFYYILHKENGSEGILKSR